MANNETNIPNNVPTIDAYLKRISLFLEDGNWSDADKYCEKVLDIDPENTCAYLGKLLAELKQKKKEDLKDCAAPFDGSKNYQKVLCFCSEDLKTELRSYIENINTRNENTRKETRKKVKLYKKIATISATVIIAIVVLALVITIRIPAYTYERALLDMNNNMFDEALEAFLSLEGYKDSEEMVLECQYRKGLWELELGRYDEAYDLLESLGNYKDAAGQIRSSKLERARALISMEAYEQAKDLLQGMEEDPEAQDVLAYGKIDDAVFFFKSAYIADGQQQLNSVKLNDSLREFIYNKAILLFQEGDYDVAKYLFVHIADYKDCKDYLTKHYTSRVVSTTRTAFLQGRGSGQTRYTYDETGKLKETVYGLGSDVHIYEGDEEIGYRFSCGSNMSYVCMYEIEKDEQGRIIRKKHVFSEMKGMSGGDTAWEYTYNDKGQMQSKRILMWETWPNYQWEYLYSTEGRLFRAIVYTVGRDGERAENAMTTIDYIYDDNDRLIEERNQKGNSNENRTWSELDTKVYHYDLMGNLIQLDHYAIRENGDKEELADTIVYEYEWVYVGK